MPRLIAILILLVCGASLDAAAQTARPSVPPDADVALVFSHDGLYTDLYRVTVDAKALPDFPAASVFDKATGDVRIPIGKLTRGAHAVEVAAVNVDGFTKARIEFDSKNPPPAPPTNLKVIVVTVTVRVE